MKQIRAFNCSIATPGEQTYFTTRSPLYRQARVVAQSTKTSAWCNTQQRWCRQVSVGTDRFPTDSACLSPYIGAETGMQRTRPPIISAPQKFSYQSDTPGSRYTVRFLQKIPTSSISSINRHPACIRAAVMFTFVLYLKPNSCVLAYSSYCHDLYKKATCRGSLSRSMISFDKFVKKGKKRKRLFNLPWAVKGCLWRFIDEWHWIWSR